MPASEVVREALRLLEIGYESGYIMQGSGDILSSGAELPAQLPFNV